MYGFLSLNHQFYPLLDLLGPQELHALNQCSRGLKEVAGRSNFFKDILKEFHINTQTRFNYSEYIFKEIQVGNYEVIITLAKKILFDLPNQAERLIRTALKRNLDNDLIKFTLSELRVNNLLISVSDKDAAATFQSIIKKRSKKHPLAKRALHNLAVLHAEGRIKSFGCKRTFKILKSEALKGDKMSKTYQVFLHFTDPSANFFTKDEMYKIIEKVKHPFAMTVKAMLQYMRWTDRMTDKIAHQYLMSSSQETRSYPTHLQLISQLYKNMFAYDSERNGDENPDKFNAICERFQLIADDPQTIAQFRRCALLMQAEMRAYGYTNWPDVDICSKNLMEIINTEQVSREDCALAKYYYALLQQPKTSNLLRLYELYGEVYGCEGVSLDIRLDCQLRRIILKHSLDYPFDEHDKRILEYFYYSKQTNEQDKGYAALYLVIYRYNTNFFREVDIQSFQMLLLINEDFLIYYQMLSKYYQGLMICNGRVSSNIISAENGCLLLREVVEEEHSHRSLKFRAMFEFAKFTQSERLQGNYDDAFRYLNILIRDQQVSSSMKIDAKMMLAEGGYLRLYRGLTDIEIHALNILIYSDVDVSPADRVHARLRAAQFVVERRTQLSGRETALRTIQEVASDQSAYAADRDLAEEILTDASCCIIL